MGNLGFFLFLTIALSPSWVRWAVSAICIPRIVFDFTRANMIAFAAINFAQQLFIFWICAHAFHQPVCGPKDDWCVIAHATKAVALWETVFCLGWIAVAAYRRRRR